MNLFLDTNAIVKLYHQEVGTEELTNFLNAHSQDLSIIISDLTKIEFYSALLMQEIRLRVVNDLLSDFDEDLKMLMVVETGRTIKDYAIHLLKDYAHDKSLRTLDAIQLSTAIITHQDIPIDYFVTSDRKLLSIVEEHFPVFNPATR